MHIVRIGNSGMILKNYVNSQKEVSSNTVTDLKIVRKQIDTNYSDYQDFKKFIFLIFYQITDFIERTQVDQITRN